MTFDYESEMLKSIYDGRETVCVLAGEMASLVEAYKAINELGLAFRAGMISQALYDYAEAICVAYQRRIERELEEF